MAEWISVKDRLPELKPKNDGDIEWKESDEVLLISKKGNYHLEKCYVDAGGIFWGDLPRSCTITHWMELPEPPKTVSKNLEHI